MQRLKANEIIHVSENVLRVLVQNRVTTIFEFLQEDVTRLSILTKLNLPEILAARNEIFEKYSASIKNGTSLLDNKLDMLKTGIANLDEMLDGGLPVGTITELCGLADSGKTQICFHIAINCIRSSRNTVLYIDSKGDFSSVKVQKILDMSGLSHKDMADIMYRIKVIQVWTMKETIELLQNLKNASIPIENLCLIILDSLPCLMFQCLDEDNKIGLSMLNNLVNCSRFLCKEKSISMICVNIQTRWVDQDVADLEDDSSTLTRTKEMFVEKRNRCLGKYWQHIPNLVLLLDKLQNNGGRNREEVTVSVIKCNRVNFVSRQCVLHISDFGFT